MQRITDLLGQKIIIIDGVFGTLLQQQVGGDVIPDELNLSKPGIIENIHHQYADAGADILSTNTFGASPVKLSGIGLGDRFEQINRSAAEIARKVADQKGKWVAGTIGPCGKLMEPMGDMTFDDMSSNYARQAAILQQGGVDMILMETFTDIQEYRAAVIGILDAVTIPLAANMAFTDGDRSLSGTDGKTFAVTADFPGLAVIGTNCGTSLENMKTIIQDMARFSHLPIMCQPNAGLPSIESGRTVFKLDAGEFADYMENFYALGVSIIGSCCGSTPQFTRKLAEKFSGRDVVKRSVCQNLCLSSRTAVKEVSGKKMFIVGERINPTGRKKLRKELETGRFTIVRSDAREQEKHGAGALDINAGLHKLDISVVRNMITVVQNVVDIPLVIDSMDPAVVEAFAKLYAGKGLINSISGEKESLQKLLPLAKKYNMAFIAVLMDEKGISSTAAERLAVADKIVQHAREYDIPLRNIVFDPLVLSAGAEIEKVAVTLETVEGLKAAYPQNKVILGLSNISFGLPNRELVNNVFLALGAGRGVDMIIANPLHETIRHQVMAIDFLRTDSKENLALYTGYFSGFKKETGEQKEMGTDTLYDNILYGDIQRGKENVAVLLETTVPVEVIDKNVIPAMNEVGRRYREKEYFLPQMMASADVVKGILPFIKQKLQADGNGGEKEVKIVFASVKGDVHDIGKNIVIGILESFNFSVKDLGKDVPVERIVEAAIDYEADVIGLSTLMTTTLPSLTETVTVLKTIEGLKGVQIFIGGAVINRGIAEELGVLYSPDGMGMVNKIKANRTR